MPNPVQPGLYCAKITLPCGSVVSLFAAIAIENRLLSRRYEQGDIFLALESSYFDCIFIDKAQSCLDGAERLHYLFLDTKTGRGKRSRNPFMGFGCERDSLLQAPP